MNNVRQSKKRDAMLALLQRTVRHPSADWVYQQMKVEFPDLSLGTVYRNLNHLSAHGLIRRTVRNAMMGWSLRIPTLFAIAAALYWTCPSRTRARTIWKPWACNMVSRLRAVSSSSAAYAGTVYAHRPTLKINDLEENYHEKMDLPCLWLHR